MIISNGAVILPVVYFFYPETANRSLEEMDLIFRKTKSIWQIVSIANNEPRRYGKNGGVVEKGEYREKEEI